MKPTREQLETWDRTLVWNAFTQMVEHEPLLLERGEGCTLVDIDGNRYLDGVSSLWCNIHGHRHPRIDAAIREQLDRVAHVTNLGSSNSTTIRLARRLVDLAPEGLGHVFFSDDGATAVEVALKMAFQYWRQRANPRPEKTVYITLGDAYHSDTLGSMSVGGVERFHAMFQPLLFDVLRLPPPDASRPPGGVTSEELAAHHLAKLEHVLQENHRRDDYRTTRAGGGRHDRASAGLPARRARTDAQVRRPAHCRRGGRWHGPDRQDVRLRTRGRIAQLPMPGQGADGGYMPLAATLATNAIWNAFLGDYAEGKTFFHGHTYGGNPLGAAAALATLDGFDEEKTLAQFPPKMDRLAAHLAPMAQLPHVGFVRQCGMIAGVEMVRDRATMAPYS